jgi:hypothetical protein
MAWLLFALAVGSPLPGCVWATSPLAGAATGILDSRRAGEGEGRTKPLQGALAGKAEEEQKTHTGREGDGRRCADEGRLASDSSRFAAPFTSHKPVVLFGSGFGCVQTDFVIEEAAKH